MHKITTLQDNKLMDLTDAQSDVARRSAENDCK